MKILAVSFLGSVLVTAMTWVLGKRFGIHDIPNQRSSHTIPKVRIGGVGFIVVFYVVLKGLSWFNILLPWRFLAIAAAVALLGLADDFFKLSPKLRLALQVLASGAVVMLGVRLESLALWGYEWSAPVWVLQGLSFVWMLGCINMYNFMDGADGLAGGFGILLCFFLYFLTPVGWHPYRVALLALAGALAGFLLFNFHPSKIFMGDVGSTFLGFFFGLYVLLIARDLSQVLVPMIMLMSPFLWDSFYTFGRRAWQRKPVWQAHREHLYQWLIISGISHGQVAGLYYGWTLFCGLMALLYQYGSRVLEVTVLLMTILMALGVTLGVKQYSKKHD